MNSTCFFLHHTKRKNQIIKFSFSSFVWGEEKTWEKIEKKINSNFHTRLLEIFCDIKKWANKFTFHCTFSLWYSHFKWLSTSELIETVPMFRKASNNYSVVLSLFLSFLPFGFFMRRCYVAHLTFVDFYYIAEGESGSIHTTTNKCFHARSRTHKPKLCVCSMVINLRRNLYSHAV